jgi:hypothetical protein
MLQRRGPCGKLDYSRCQAARELAQSNKADPTRWLLSPLSDVVNPAVTCFAFVAVQAKTPTRKTQVAKCSIQKSQQKSGFFYDSVNSRVTAGQLKFELISVAELRRQSN